MRINPQSAPKIQEVQGVGYEDLVIQEKKLMLTVKVY